MKIFKTSYLILFYGFIFGFLFLFNSCEKKTNSGSSGSSNIKLNSDDSVIVPIPGNPDSATSIDPKIKQVFSITASGISSIYTSDNSDASSNKNCNLKQKTSNGSVTAGVALSTAYYYHTSDYKIGPNFFNAAQPFYLEFLKQNDNETPIIFNDNKEFMGRYIGESRSQYIAGSILIPRNEIEADCSHGTKLLFSVIPKTAPDLLTLISSNNKAPISVAVFPTLYPSISIGQINDKIQIDDKKFTILTDPVAEYQLTKNTFSTNYCDPLKNYNLQLIYKLNNPTDTVTFNKFPQNYSTIIQSIDENSNYQNLQTLKDSKLIFTDYTPTNADINNYSLAPFSKTGLESLNLGSGYISATLTSDNLKEICKNNYSVSILKNIDFASLNVKFVDPNAVLMSIIHNNSGGGNVLKQPEMTVLKCLDNSNNGLNCNQILHIDVTPSESLSYAGLGMIANDKNYYVSAMQDGKNRFLICPINGKGNCKQVIYSDRNDLTNIKFAISSTNLFIVRGQKSLSQTTKVNDKTYNTFKQLPPVVYQCDLSQYKCNEINLNYNGYSDSRFESVSIAGNSLYIGNGTVGNVTICNLLSNSCSTIPGSNFGQIAQVQGSDKFGSSLFINANSIFITERPPNDVDNISIYQCDLNLTSCKKTNINVVDIHQYNGSQGFRILSGQDNIIRLGCTDPNLDPTTYAPCRDTLRCEISNNFDCVRTKTVLPVTSDLVKGFNLFGLGGVVSIPSK